jgi:mannosylglycerate hydrolase
VISSGPLRAELAVARTYDWPVGVEPDGSARTKEVARVEVTTRVELRAGEPFARLRISFDNRCRDHRVRLHVPLAHAATGSVAEGQFAVVERGLEVEGGYGETPIATYPARGFVEAGGIAVLLEHVLEYEVVDGRELALTLLRSIGLISRNENSWRQDPAGPELAIPEAQLVGPRVVSFAVFPHTDTWTADRVLRQMERYQHPFLSAPGTGANGAAQEQSGLELEGDGVVLSSLRRREGQLELTLACEEPSSRAVTLRGASAPGGELRLELGAWEIRTIWLQ